MSTRRRGLARLFSRLSAALLLAPVILLFVVTVAADAMGVTLPWNNTDHAFAIFFWCLLCATLLALFTGVVDADRAEDAAELFVGDRDLRVRRGASERVIPRDQIASGIVLRSYREPYVELHLRRGRIVRAGMRSRKRAEALLDALGLGADRHRVAVPIGTQRRPAVAGCAGFAVASIASPVVAVALERALGTLAPILAALLVTTVTLLARRLFLPQELVIGADGVHVRGRFRDRFLRCEEIAEVRADGADLVIAPGTGHRVWRIRCPDGYFALGLVTRIQDAMALARGGSPRSAITDALDPGERPLAAWREALSGLLKDGGAYRGAFVQEEDVLDVLEDPAAPAKLRIGAAIALRSSRHEEARKRVRVAAESCADQALREALEAAADEDLDERPIVKALRS